MKYERSRWFRFMEGVVDGINLLELIWVLAALALTIFFFAKY